VKLVSQDKGIILIKSVRVQDVEEKYCRERERQRRK
jgi:hypothetical protein